MPGKSKHQRALQLVEANRLQDGLRLLSSALKDQESSDLWNDWATVKVACNEISDARRGYERALALDPENSRSQFNLGLLLVNAGEQERGMALLQQSSHKLGPEEQKITAALLQQHQGNSKADPSPEQAPASKPRPQNVLIIHEVLPQFDRSGSDMRLLQVIRRFRALGHEVTCIGRHSGEHGIYESTLHEIGVKTFAGDAERLRAQNLDISPEWKFDDILAQEKFDVAILFHWFWSGISVTEQYLNDIRRLSPETRIIMLTDDLHGIREWRMAQLSGLINDRERALDFLARELECCRASDLVLTISPDDRRGLLELAPELNIEMLPMTTDITREVPSFESRKDFLFLANFDNVANRDAVAWLCHEIWPRIHRTLPDTTLHLAGNNIPRELGATGGVRIIGHVADLESTLKAFRVFLSPIRYGTGIKTKNVLAMANGVPLVTTTIGAEGMSLTDCGNVFIADSTNLFVQKAVALYNDAELWNRMSASALSHMKAEFSVHRLDAQIAAILKKAGELEPRPFDPDHRFSFNLVEEFHPEVLTHQPARERFEKRVLGYVDLAERLLQVGKPAEAREQLRHVFVYVRGQAPRVPFFARVFSLLERCYRETGEPEAAAQCGHEAKLCMPELNPVLRTKSPAAPRRQTGPVISIVIPTYNRKMKLERCLQALTQQSFPQEKFEVIVVDDGSSDGTQDLISSQRTSFPLHYYRQSNQGAGAARRAGVEHARGEYLLLINDDTIADQRLLQTHLEAQEANKNKCPAVLGTFEYEPAARNRALTCFLSVDPFMFPQKNMEPGRFYGPEQFVTCNLSIARELVLKAGSFDPAFRVGEDSDLGLRVAELGCKVLYHPAAMAWHDHLDITFNDIVRRAKAYGPIYLMLLRKFPTLVVPTPFASLRAPIGAGDIDVLRTMLDGRRNDILQAVEALQQYDNLDFLSFFNLPSQTGISSDVIIDLFSRAVPQIHWFFVLDQLCSTWLLGEGRNADATLVAKGLEIPPTDQHEALAPELPA